MCLQRDLDEYRKAIARSTNEKVRLFSEMGRLVLNEQIPDPRLRTAIFRRIPKETLQNAVEEAEQIARPLDDNHFDFLDKRYSYLRQFTPALLEGFDFRSNAVRLQRFVATPSALDSDPLLEAIQAVVNLNTSGRRIIPDEAPIDFVPPKWRDWVIGSKRGAIVLWCAQRLPRPGKSIVTTTNCVCCTN